jgi:hypothetical protein
MDSFEASPRDYFEAWRLPSTEPLYLDDANFHRLADQGNVAASRLAAGGGAGAFWSGGQFQVPGCTVSFLGRNEFEVKLEGLHYAGFTAAGLPIPAGGGPTPTLLRCSAPGLAQNDSVVVGLEATRPGLPPDPTAAVAKLPVPPEWFAEHLPLAVGIVSDRFLRYEWQPRTLRAPFTPLTSSPRRATQAVKDLLESTGRLLEVSRRLAMPHLSSLAASLESVFLLLENTSPPVRLAAALQVRAMVTRLMEWFTPYQWKWPAWVDEPVVSAAAHFDGPIEELLECARDGLNVVRKAALGEAPPRALSKRPDWPRGVTPSDQQFLFELVSLQGAGARAGRLSSVGARASSSTAWDLSLARDIRASRLGLLVLALQSPVVKPVQSVLSVEIHDTMAGKAYPPNRFQWPIKAGITSEIFLLPGKVFDILPQDSLTRDGLLLRLQPDPAAPALRGCLLLGVSGEWNQW